MNKLLFVVISVLLAGCSSKTNNPAIAPAFDLSCNLNEGYTSPVAAERHDAQTTFKATAILIHGKNGAPSRTHIQSLTSDLSNDGFDVVVPQMPWSGINWNGTLCNGIEQMNNLVDAEKTAGNSVVLIGHSLAGPIVLAYEALENTTASDGLLVLAPGHLVPQSSVLASEHAASIAKAESLIAQDLGAVESTFETYNGGVSVTLTTTPEIYLSYHSDSQFPNIKTSLPIVDVPILWLAGIDDPLTSVVENTFGITDKIPAGENNIYKVVAGDHFTVVDSVLAELNPWYDTISTQ